MQMPMQVRLFDRACPTVACRCPGTRQALGAWAARRTNAAFTLVEALLRIQDPEEETDLEGLSLEGLADTEQPGWQAKLAQQLLGGGEPAYREEDLWIQQRLRCVYRSL